MDACHVLLGRPWLFDRRIIHDGRMNTYTFHQDQKKIALTPLKSAHSLKPKNDPRKDVFLTTLLKSQRHEYEAFKEWILLHQEASKPTAQEPIATAQTHPLLSPLLNDFQHVFPQDIPHSPHKMSQAPILSPQRVALSVKTLTILLWSAGMGTLPPWPNVRITWRRRRTLRCV